MLNSLSANPKKSSNTLKKLTFLNIIGSTDRKILQEVILKLLKPFFTVIVIQTI